MPTPSAVSVPLAALAAAGVTIPHAIGLGLIAYAPLADGLHVASLALWSAAIPGAIAALVARRTGVVHAPSTVVALLYAAIVAVVASQGRELGMSAAQMLAACGLTAATGFALQWFLGVMRIASIARFLPISVMHGFAAGVGLSMIFGQIRLGFGAGGWNPSPSLAICAAAALGVVVIARGVNLRWPRLPGLLPGAAIAAVLLWLSGLAPMIPAAASPAHFSLPPLPDFGGVPWLDLLERRGVQLVSLAMLMAVVNSLDVLVFNQELDLQHDLRADPNQALRRESAVGIACALAGLIPASTSASRTRMSLAQGGSSSHAGAGHAGIMLLVAATGHWWLQWAPMACFSGAMLLAGFMQIPSAMWSRRYARIDQGSWTQSWLVAIVFPVSGGGGALVTGLAVATFVLLHTSANSALRRCHLDGQVRSRRLRRAAHEAWLAPRMNRVAVIELQGVMSFGVAAHMAEQVKSLLKPHQDSVILDVHRVAVWDATALVQLGALGRDLARGGRHLAVSGMRQTDAEQLRTPALMFADLDRALECAEDALLEEQPDAQRPRRAGDMLADLGENLSPAAHAALENAMDRLAIAEGQCIFRAGDSQRDMYVVQSGVVTLATEWPPEGGIRLASIGRGMPFGEMAFLNGLPRTACAGAVGAPVEVARLTPSAFESWAALHPADATVFMRNLALIGTTRLATTTRQLRAALE